MNNIDKKIIYSLLCNNGLLKYLDTKDKTEFSYTCKFIFLKCTRYRLSNYKFNFSDFYKYTESINTWGKSPEEIYNSQLKYLDNIITKYKTHILSLTCSRNDNYFIIEYFSLYFNNLNSLCLSDLFIPKNIFKNVIENLRNVRSLELIKIGVVFNKDDQSKFQLKFPKYLTKLIVANCYQLNYDFKDSIDLKISGILTANMSRNCLDISDSSISNIKYLSWSNPYNSSIIVLNQLLSNNQKLTTLEVPMNNLNTESLYILSNIRGLTRLNLSLSSESIPDINTLIELPSVRTIELKSVFGIDTHSVSQLVQICPNLEELIYNLTLGNIDHMRKIVKNIPNLKKLHIINIDLDHLSIAPFSNSSLEHLELTSSSDLEVSLDMFNNFNKLVSIKVSGLSKQNNGHNYMILIIDEIHYWRKINYFNSVVYWKIA